MKNNTITIDLTTNKFKNIKIPFYLIYKIFGLV